MRSGITLGMRYSEKARNSTQPKLTHNLETYRFIITQPSIQAEIPICVCMDGRRTRSLNITSSTIGAPIGRPECQRVLLLLIRGTYDIYETIRINQPSIIGIATFKQYWSVRQTKRTSGSVSVSEHFKKWESLGMPLGKMYETALTVEGYQSNGSANVTTNVLTIGGQSK